MVSLSGKRYVNVYNNNHNLSDDFDDSDSESSSSSTVNNITKGKYNQAGVTKTFHTNLEEQNTRFHFATSKSISRKRKSSEGSNQSNNNNKKQRCYSKNALMARENRIKKKIYLENLEEAVDKYKDKNKKLSSILDNQSMLIADLRKEVKYLKNVLANSTDIGRLLKCINQNTGLQTINSVSSNTNDKTNDTHPWAELKNFDLNGELSTGDLLCNFENDLFSDVYPSSLMTNDALPQLEETPRTTDAYNLDSREDVGVCLHIAKHKVSLEFCSACSENALTAWNQK